MNIASMTGFAKKTVTGAWGVVTWELKTLNHRYLEIYLRLPEALREFDQDIRKILQNKILRGKVEAVLNFSAKEEASLAQTINESKIKQLAHATQIIQPYFPNLQVSAMEILAWPGVLQIQEAVTPLVKDVIYRSLEEVLQEIVRVRLREGQSIVEFILQRLQEIRQIVLKVQEYLPGSLAIIREKIINRFMELSLNIDQERLAQEMVWYTQKIDIAEEIQRLYAHLEEAHRIIKEGNAIGRRLDFLSQEFNREANTLASKSVDVNITQLAVELKVQIEQIREQVQNLE